ncbi:MAG: hypothetical protein GYA24_05095 [Candidatus Lokiarchaeota archaeon]|nr:hypothetical protein [Candidatus Lokiarchaeota archaeon]
MGNTDGTRNKIITVTVNNTHIVIFFLMETTSSSFAWSILQDLSIKGRSTRSEKSRAEGHRCATDQDFPRSCHEIPILTKKHGLEGFIQDIRVRAMLYPGPYQPGISARRLAIKTDRLITRTRDRLLEIVIQNGRITRE